MKIAEIMPVLELCGVTRFVVDLCNRLAQAHEVVLIVFYPVSENGRAGLSEQVRLLEAGKKPGIDLGLPLRLRKLLQQEQADVVHLHTASALQYAALAILSYRKSRYFYTLHSEAGFEIPSRLIRIMTEYTLLRSVLCRVISNSAFVADSLTFPTPVIPLGRDLQKHRLYDENAHRQMAVIRQRHGGSVLLHVSNLTPVKNQHMLCRVVQQMCNNGANVELVLIGNAPDEAYFRCLMPLLKHERIHYLGQKNNIPAYMAEADFFCLSSLTESGPLVLIEAFFAGLIPVCTPCGDVPNKIQHGINGLCARDCSQQAYAEALQTALDMPSEQRSRMAAASKQSYAAYSMDTCVKRYLQLFQQEPA